MINTHQMSRGKMNHSLPETMNMLK